MPKLTKTEAAERIAKLRREVEHHRYLYHVLDRQEISDAANDSLKNELKQLEAQFPELRTPDSPSQRVAGEVRQGFKKVRHTQPVLSWRILFLWTKFWIGKNGCVSWSAGELMIISSKPSWMGYQ